jgi:tetratricopeptide (TPR) repeat protein
MSRSVMATLLFALAIALGSYGAPAPDGKNAAPAGDDVQRARTAFNQGQREYLLGHYAEALPLFEQAYKIKPLPGLLYNIGQCYRLLGNMEQARRLYRNFIDTAPESPQVADATEKLKELEKAIKAHSDTRNSPPTGLANPDNSAVVPGALDTAVSGAVKAHAPNQDPTALAVPAPAAALPASPSASVVVVAVNPTAPSRPMRIVGWTLLGTSVAAAGAGAVFGLGAKSSAADWSGATNSASWQSAQDDSRSKAKLATLSWIAAGALAAAGIAALLFLDHP